VWKNKSKYRRLKIEKYIFIFLELKNFIFLQKNKTYKYDW